VPARYATLVLVLAFGGLRFGEATALRRRDISSDGQRVNVGRSVRFVGEPKTDAGRRTVAVPGFVSTGLADHLSEALPPFNLVLEARPSDGTSVLAEQVPFEIATLHAPMARPSGSVRAPSPNCGGPACWSST
jgi:integrase